ncbi:phage tail length tape measure family protein [Comamonas testosteroni]|uniref:phage tail length tape measure family protein n=1 Tax=Comamonas testosteroni TaxID=285 RepID=UPI0023AA3D76|nr:phage tail length tape measure family protein [Comamonas testosteroni]WEE79570.1 phage tail length tape measure family protein [Comamonas testosteroni]
MSGNNNTVEYRAKLDVSGVKSGAAEAAQAISGIDGGPAAQSIQSVGAEAAQMATRVQAGSEKASEGLKQVALAGQQAAAGTQGLRQAQAGLNDTSPQYQRALDAANNLHKAGAISAAQHAQAMRMLPMQMTDVVTSVASGMPIWMVAIQQGGQIKDSFGGIGNAARAMVGAITPATAAIGGLSVGAGLVAAAYYQGSAEQDKFRQLTVLNGNAAGVTAEALSRMSRETDGIYGTQSKAAEGLAILAGSGKIARESLVEFTVMAVRMEDLAGRSIEQTAKDLEQLGTKPAEASAKLNESYNYLTPAVYRQIRALEDQGRAEEAAALAQKTYSDAMSSRAKQLEAELGYIERGWRGARDLAKEAWDAFLNIGRPTTVEDRAKSQIEALEEAIRRRKEQNANLGIKDGKATAELEARLENAKGLLQLTESAGKATAEAIDEENKARQHGIDLQKEAARYASDAVKKQVELDQAKAKYEPLTRVPVGASKEEIKEATQAAKDYAALVAGIEQKYSKKGGKGAGAISVSDTDLASMRSQLVAAQQYHQQLLTMGSGATELNTAERESLKIAEQIKLATDGKTIARLKEKQAIADTLAAQLRSNEGLEQSYKAHQQAIDANYKDAQAIGQRARDQAAANEVFGKGRTAIEQMTLATLQHQLAEAEGSDSFDPRYIASLREKIAAQKDFAAALGQADYKAVQQRADELLRNAQEMGKSYQLEFELSGASAQQRQIIAAQRQVELRYAKEIAAVDKLNLDDAGKKAALATLEQARLQELANAGAKVNLQVWSESVQQYDDVFRKGFADMLNSGKSGWKSFTTSLATTFKTTVADQLYKAFAQPFVVRIVGQMLGITGAAGATGTAASLAGSSGILSSGSNLLNGGFADWSTWGAKGSTWMMDQGMSLVTKGWESAGSSLMSLGQTVQSADAYLKTLPGFDGGLGSAAGYLGSIYSLTQGQYGTAIGSAIGTYIMPGIGTMVGSVLGGLVDGLGIFGGETKQTGSGITGSLGGALSSYAEFEKDGGWFGSDRSWSKIGKLEANAALQETFKGLQINIGEQAKALGLSSDAVKKYTRDIRFSTEGLTGDQITARLQEEMAAAGNTMAALVLGTDKYTKAGETQSATLTRLSTSLAATNATFETLGNKLYSVGLTGADMASKLVANFGTVDAYISASEAYYKTYYSQAERANNSTAAMTKQLSELGLALPGTQSEFRALVSSLDLTTEHGRKAYAMLLQMAPQFDETAKQLDELAKAAAADLISTYTRAAAVAPGMQIAREAMSGTTSQAQTLGGSMSSINKILGDSSSGVLTWSNQVQSTTAALNPAQAAVGVLRSEIYALQTSASGTVINIDGLAKALAGVDTKTFTATITSAFELIAQRVKEDLNSIASERQAVREAAISILGPTVMTPAQIRAQIQQQTVSLPGQTGIANAQSALARADALVNQRQNEYATAYANNANKAPGLQSSAAALDAKRGDAARALVATYLRHGNIQSGIQGEYVPGSLQGLVTYEDTQANMLAKLQNLPTSEIQAFADQLTRLGASGLRAGLGSTNSYLNAMAAYQKAMDEEAANRAKAQSLRDQAAALANKVTTAEQALAAARAAQTNASNNAQKAQLDYVAALQKYSVDSGKAVSNLSKLREETVAYYQSQAQLAQAMNASASGLRSTVADIRFSQMSTAGQFANLQERYNVAYSMAMSTTGETLAGYGSEMNSLLQPLLQKAQEAGLGGAEYASLVNTLLARAEAIAGRIEKDAPKNYQEESLGLLGQIDSTLAALEAGAKSSDQVMTEAIKAGTDTTRDGLRAVIAALQGRPVPAFAAGGLHSGGLRLVGERGPELEVTGPARYFSADMTRSMLAAPSQGLDLAPLLAELVRLRHELSDLRAERRADAGAIATNTGKTHRILDRLTVEGFPVRNADGQRFVMYLEAV